MEAKKKSTGIVFWLVIAGLVLTGASYFRSGDGGSYPSFAGGSLPPIQSSGTWLNSVAPITWDTLSGDVVWLEFSFLH